ncbi:hypothetical protein PLESTM_000554700 [Pleodorina starrii]|nr:hypothetical protein PLESTM_000554700 [Pleodorina starrii]
MYYSRKDCCGDLNYTFAAGGAAVDNSSILSALHRNGVIHSAQSHNLSLTDNVTTILINPPRPARYVSVQGSPLRNATSVFLEVAELEVYGSPAACTLLPQYGAGYGDDAAALSTSSEPDAGACCQACYTSPTCLYWDFDLANRTCRLKGNQAGAIPPGRAIPGFWMDDNRVAGGKRGASIYDVS